MRRLRPVLFTFVAMTLGVIAVLTIGAETRIGLELAFAARRAVGATSVCTFDIDGAGRFRMFLDPDSIGFAPNVRAKGIWEPEETALFVRSVRRGDIVVDVGAYDGYYTLLGARLVGNEGRVYAFEPDPTNFHYLSRNVRLNGFANVVVENKAASNESGVITIHTLASAREDTRIYLPADGPRTSIEVEAVRLDDYFAGREEHLDFVKVDTQGAEKVIVEGMLGIAAQSDDLLMMLEYFPALLRAFGTTPAELLALLGRLDLDLYTLRGGLHPTDPEALLAMFPKAGPTLIAVSKTRRVLPAADRASASVSEARPRVDD